jgi:PBSX family phage terminase large subunit
MVAEAPPAIKLLRHQLEFVHARDPWLLTDGGRGSGKTRGLAAKIAARAKSHPNAREGLFRQRLIDLRTTTLRSLLEGDGSAPPILMPGSYHHNQQLKTIKLYGGGEIVYNGMDQGDVGRQMGSTGRGSSMNLSGAAFDEWVEMNEAAVVQVAMSVRLKVPGLTLQRYGACNPGPPSHWLAKRFGMEPGGRPRDGHRRIMAPARDNFFNPPEYLAELRSLKGVARERYWLGKWVGSDGLVYDRWDRAIHVVDTVPAHKRVVIAVDDGYTDPFVALRIVLDSDGRACVADEVYESGLLPDEKVERVRAMVAGDEAEVVVDSAAPDLIALLRSRGFNAVPADKGQGSVNYGIGLVQNRLAEAGDARVRLTVNAGCVNTIREFETYEWKPGADGLKDQPRDADNHAMDALRYAIRSIEGERGAVGYVPEVASYRDDSHMWTEWN